MARSSPRNRRVRTGRACPRHACVVAGRAIADDRYSLARKNGDASRPTARTCGNLDGVAINGGVCWAIDDRVHIGLIARRSGIGSLCLCKGRKKKQ